MILLVDNSNTRTKFMLAERERMLVDSLVSIPTAGLTRENVADVVKEMPIRGVILASVVPPAAAIIQESFGGKCPVITLDAETMVTGVQYDYPGTETLGADRIANIIAAAHHYPLPCVAVDAGTAITFDVVLPGKEKARFVGGVISPGISTMLSSLCSGTALLPKVQISLPVAPIGSSTQEAIQAGVYWGACGMVDTVLQQIEDTLKCSPYVVATGGDAPLLASQCKKIDKVDDLLTFRGLWRVAQDVL